VSMRALYRRQRLASDQQQGLRHDVSSFLEASSSPPSHPACTPPSLRKVGTPWHSTHVAPLFSESCTINTNDGSLADTVASVAPAYLEPSKAQWSVPDAAGDGLGHRSAPSAAGSGMPKTTDAHEHTSVGASCDGAARVRTGRSSCSAAAALPRPHAPEAGLHGAGALLEQPHKETAPQAANVVAVTALARAEESHTIGHTWTPSHPNTRRSGPGDSAAVEMQFKNVATSFVFGTQEQQLQPAGSLHPVPHMKYDSVPCDMFDAAHMHVPETLIPHFPCPARFTQATENGAPAATAPRQRPAFSRTSAEGVTAIKPGAACHGRGHEDLRATRSREERRVQVVVRGFPPPGTTTRWLPKHKSNVHRRFLPHRTLGGPLLDRGATSFVHIDPGLGGWARLCEAQEKAVWTAVERALAPPQSTEGMVSASAAVAVAEQGGLARTPQPVERPLRHLVPFSIHEEAWDVSVYVRPAQHSCLTPFVN
jgi:hypothetical protein